MPKDKKMFYDTVPSDYICLAVSDHRAVEPCAGLSVGILAVAFVP